MTIKLGTPGSAASAGSLAGIRADFSIAPNFGSVADQAAMVALSDATPGSTCYRADTGTIWMLKVAPFSAAGNWFDTYSSYAAAVATAAIDATTKANTAQSLAISTGAIDATTKANAAQAAAIAAAAADATTKANTAQATAIATASTDATTKSNTAQSNAISAAYAADVSISATASAALARSGGTMTGQFMTAARIAVAAAGTIDVPALGVNYFDVTGGAGPITSFGTPPAGTIQFTVCFFDAGVVLTHAASGATSIRLPTLANIVTQIGDVAVFTSRAAASGWRCVSYTRQDGTPLAGGGGGSATWGGIGGTIANQADLMALVNGPGTIDLNATTGLTAASHANRILKNTSATPYTYTVQTDAIGGTSGNEFFLAYQQGTGAVTIAGAGVTIAAPVGTTLISPGQGRFVGVQRVGANAWAATQLSGGSGSGGGSTFSSSMANMYHLPRANNTTFDLIGTTALTALGTVTAVTCDGTALKSRPSVDLIAASAAGADASVRGGLFYFNPGLIDGVIEGGSAITDAIGTIGRFYMGLVNNVNGGMGTEATSAFAGGFLGMCAETNDTNMSMLFRDTGGAVATKTTLGANFPVGTDGYMLKIEYYASGPRRFVWTVTNMTTLNTATGTWTSSPALPAVTENFAWAVTRKANAVTAGASAIRYYGVVAGGLRS